MALSHENGDKPSESAPLVDKSKVKPTTCRQKLAKWMFLGQAALFALAVTPMIIADKLSVGNSDILDKLRGMYDWESVPSHPWDPKMVMAAYGIVEQQILMAMLSIFFIGGLTFALRRSTEQIWAMRVFLPVWSSLLMLSLVTKEWNLTYTTQDIIELVVVLGLYFAMAGLWYVAEPSQGAAPGAYRHKPALHLACAHAVGTFCWAGPVLFNTWVPYTYVNAMYAASAMGFCIVQYFTAAKDTPRYIHIIEHSLWCLFTGYYAWQSTFANVAEYNAVPMVLACASHIIAFAYTLAL